MKLKESQLRKIVRRALLAELEGWKPNFGRSRGGGGGGSDWWGYEGPDLGDDPWGGYVDDDGGDDGGDLGEVDESDDAKELDEADLDEEEGWPPGNYGQSPDHAAAQDATANADGC